MSNHIPNYRALTTEQKNYLETISTAARMLCQFSIRYADSTPADVLIRLTEKAKFWDYHSKHLQYGELLELLTAGLEWLVQEAHSAWNLPPPALDPLQ